MKKAKVVAVNPQGRLSVKRMERTLYKFACNYLTMEIQENTLQLKPDQTSS